MKGLILKDLYCILRYGRTFVLVAVIYLVISLSSGGNVTVFSSMMGALFPILALSTFSYDELSKWDRYAMTFPLSRRQVVRAKYLLVLLLCLVSIGFATLSGLLLRLTGNQTPLIESLSSGAAVAMVILAMLSLSLPIIYKYGVEKGRMALVVVYLVPTLGFILLSKSGLTMPDSRQLAWILPIVPLLVLALLACSYAVSCRIYQRREL